MKIELNKEEAQLIRDMISFASSPEVEGSFFDMIYEEISEEETERLYKLYKKIYKKLNMSVKYNSNNIMK